MEKVARTAAQLRDQITAAEKNLQDLKNELARIQVESHAQNSLQDLAINDKTDPVTNGQWPLSPEEYKRYGRQMIVPSVGIQGQLRLKAASVLIVGAGGLGCPAAAYLAGAGVGTIGIIDGDEVETSNLHRQILHSTTKVGMKKVDSAISFLKSLNPNIKYNAHTTHLTPENSQTIVSKYDLVLDCTDHPTSRYLISDICVLLQKPLVSASALKTDGQLIVLNSPPLPAGDEDGGPCYRCVFPKPPPAESVVSCGDGGIIGPVVGVMGVLQALEAIKLIAGGKLVPKIVAEGMPNPSMLLFSANSSPPFRSVKLRLRRMDCFACSAKAGLTLESLSSGSLDYVLFCGVTNPVSILGPNERVEAKEYEKIREGKKEHLLVDVREKVQFDICNIAGSINVPFSTFQGRAPALEEGSPSWVPDTLPPGAPIYVVCRLGNDSQLVTRKLKEAGLDKNGKWIGDISGGLKSWKEQVDNSWPEY